jgi:hypothetical protein
VVQPHGCHAEKNYDHKKDTAQAQQVIQKTVLGVVHAQEQAEQHRECFADCQQSIGVFNG